MKGNCREKIKVK